MKQVFNIFPTCVISIDDFLSKDQCLDITKYILSGKPQTQQHDAIKGNGVSYYTEKSDFITEVSKNIPSCYNIKEAIFNEVKAYESTAGIVITEFNNSWFNIQNKDSLLIDHSHPMSIISGALYINTDEDSSSIYFSNPNPFNSFQDVGKLTDYTYEKYWIKPCVGQLILFPSWLKHGSNNTLNKTTNRIVISFNTK